MPVKLNFYDHILETDAGRWSCQSEPDLAVAVQQICDDYFAKTDEYIVDIDEQGAKYIAHLIEAKILEITHHPFDLNEPERKLVKRYVLKDT